MTLRRTCQRYLLYLDCSSGPKSLTSTISNHFLTTYQQEKSTPVEIESINLWNSQLPEFTLECMHSSFAISKGIGTPEDHNRLKKIHQMIDQLLEAEVLVIACPMWNFGVPFVMKQYIDCVMQPGLSVQEDLSKSKSLIVVSSAGGIVPPEKDLLTPQLQHVFGLAGFSNMYNVALRNTSRKDPHDIIERANVQVEAIVRDLIKEDMEQESVV